MAIHYNAYPMYGLNKFRSFLNPTPYESRKNKYLLFDTNDEVMDFCYDMLEDHNCLNAAIFAVSIDENYLAIMKSYNPEAGEVEYYMCESDDPQMFSRVDGDFRFCCYNLMFEEKPGKWIIR